MCWQAGKVATLNSGASDVLCKDVTKVPDDAVEATAVDQAESLFQPQVLAAKVGDFKAGWVGVSRREAAAALNGRGAVVKPENGKSLGSQPAADLTVSAAHIHDELIFRKPAGVDRFTEFLLRLVGFPEWANSGLSHRRSHLRRCRRCVQLGNTCSM